MPPSPIIIIVFSRIIYPQNPIIIIVFYRINIPQNPSIIIFRPLDFLAPLLERLLAHQAAGARGGNPKKEDCRDTSQGEGTGAIKSLRIGVRKVFFFFLNWV